MKKPVPRKILVIDDEPQLVDMVKMRLEANGFQVLSAKDGKEGLEKVRQEKPDLVLLDVMMPGMDGFEVFKRIKKDPKTMLIPVIMLTARGEVQSIFRAKDLRVTDYMIKPFEEQELLTLIRRYVA